MIPDWMDKRTAQSMLSMMGPAKYAEMVATNAKPTDFQRELKAAGITETDPRYQSLTQAKLNKDTYIPAQEVSATADLIDPITHEVMRKGAAPAQASHVEWKDVGDKLMPVDSITGQAVPGLQPMAKKDTPAGARVSFSGQRSDLLAALASKGVSLPAGLRSQSQMAATIDGLLAKYPQNTPDEIADRIATGQIDFGAAKKETQISAGQAGKVAVAVNELSTFGDQVLEASKAVPRGSFIPLNKLMQMTDAQISDPALINYKVKMQSLNNAYDTLAARGGTDADKRAHIMRCSTRPPRRRAWTHSSRRSKTKAAPRKRPPTRRRRRTSTARAKVRQSPSPTQNAQGWVCTPTPKATKRTCRRTVSSSKRCASGLRSQHRSACPEPTPPAAGGFDLSTAMPEGVDPMAVHLQRLAQLEADIKNAQKRKPRPCGQCVGSHEELPERIRRHGVVARLRHRIDATRWRWRPAHRAPRLHSRHGRRWRSQRRASAARAHLGASFGCG
jgi:hypothetical protein